MTGNPRSVCDGAAYAVHLKSISGVALMRVL
jgi:hypothetical protein